MTTLSGAMSAVVDASFVVRRLLPGPIQERCRSVHEDLVRRGFTLVAPSLLAYEVTSGLTKAVHFGSLRSERARQVLSELAALDLKFIPSDDAQNRAALDWTVRLRRAAAYDSFYLALAEGLRADLWTADERLVNAANVPWVRLVTERR